MCRQVTPVPVRPDLWAKSHSEAIGDFIELLVPVEVFGSVWRFLDAIGKLDAAIANPQNPVRSLTDVLVYVLPTKCDEGRLAAVILWVELEIGVHLH